MGDARFCVARSSARKNKLAFLSTDDLTAECLTSFAEIEPAHAHSLSQLWRLLLRLRSLATVGEAGRRGTALLSVRGKPGGVLCRHWRSRFAAFFAASGRALANTPAAFFAAKMFRRPTWGRGSARRRRSLPQRNRARGGAGRRRLFFRRRSGGSPPITASTRPSSALVAEIYRRFDVRRRAGRKRGGAAACRPAGGGGAERRVFCGGGGGGGGGPRPPPPPHPRAQGGRDRSQRRRVLCGGVKRPARKRRVSFAFGGAFFAPRKTPRADFCFQGSEGGISPGHSGRGLSAKSLRGQRGASTFPGLSWNWRIHGIRPSRCCGSCSWLCSCPGRVGDIGCKDRSIAWRLPLCSPCRPA